MEPERPIKWDDGAGNQVVLASAYEELEQKLSGTEKAYGELDAWLDDALKVLGIDTVFEIESAANKLAEVEAERDGISDERDELSRILLTREEERAAADARAQEAIEGCERVERQREEARRGEDEFKARAERAEEALRETAGRLDRWEKSPWVKSPSLAMEMIELLQYHILPALSSEPNRSKLAIADIEAYERWEAEGSSTEIDKSDENGVTALDQAVVEDMAGSDTGAPSQTCEEGS